LDDLDKKQKWILEWMHNNEDTVNIYNQKFVDDYIKEFNPKHAVQPYGASSCPELGRKLSDLYKKYYLLRGKIGLSEMYVGFAKWVYVYELP